MYARSFFLVVCMTIVAATAQAPRHFRSLESVPGFYIPHVDHRRQNTFREFHHHDEHTGEFVHLKYNATHTGESFSEIRAPSTTWLQCFFNNTQLLIGHNDIASAKKFYAQVSSSDIVTSQPPVLCADGNPVALRIVKVKMADTHTIYIQGRPLHFLEPWKHINVEFETNLLPEDSIARMERQENHKEKMHATADDTAAPQKAKNPGVNEFLLDSDMYQLRQAEIFARQRDEQRDMVAKEREKLISLNLTDPTQPPTVSTALPLIHNRHALHPMDMTATGDWGLGFSLISPWIKIEMVSDHNWNWNLERTETGGVLQRAIKSFFGTTVNLEINASVILRPVIRLKLDWDDGKLNALEMFVDVYYQYLFMPTFSFDGQLTKTGFSAAMVSLQFPGIVIPLGFLAISLCPTFDLTLNLDFKIDKAAKLFFRTMNVGSARFGIQNIPSKGIERVGTNTRPFGVPNGYNAVLGSECKPTHWSTFSTLTKNLEQCASACNADAKCLYFSHDKTTFKCMLATDCTNKTTAYIKAQTGAPWIIQSGNTFYFQRMKEVERGPIDKATQVTISAYIQAGLGLSLTLGVCQAGFGLGGPSIALSFGKDFSAKVATQGTTNSLTISDNFVFTVSVGAALSFTLNILGITVTVLSINLASTALFTLKIPIVSIVMIFDAKTFLPICPFFIQIYGEKDIEFLKVSYIGQDVSTSILEATTCPKRDLAMNTKSPKLLSHHNNEFNTLQGAFSPNVGDVWTGVCDSEVFAYTTRLQFVSKTTFLLAILINNGEAQGVDWKTTACTVRGLYQADPNEFNNPSGRMTFRRRVDPDFDIDKCWMQRIPSRISVQTTTAGTQKGMWIYMNASSCADIHLRAGSDPAVLKEGETIINEQTMESDFAQLILQQDGDVVLYSYETDEVVWSSGTAVPATMGGKQIQTSLSLMSGVISIETRYGVGGSLVARKVLNPNSTGGGRFLVIQDCDMKLYQTVPFINPVWTLRNLPCPKIGMQVSTPKWHRGGNVMMIGETMKANSALYNSNGMFEHELGVIHYIRWNTLAATWSSLNDETNRRPRTAAFSFHFNGDLVLIDYEGKIQWRSNTAGLGGTVLRLEKCDVNMYTYYPGGKKVWSIAGDPSCPDTIDTARLKPAALTAFPTSDGRIEPGSFLLPGQAVKSRFGLLIHLPDGNVAIYGRNNQTVWTPLWSTNTAGKCTTAFSFQYDGNLTLYGCPNEGSPILWNANVVSQSPKMVTFGDDCTFKLLNAKQHVLNFRPESVAKVISDQTCPQNLATISQYDDYTDCWYLEQGYPLRRGQSIRTADAVLLHQPDGDVVFFAMNPVRVLWRSNTAGKCTSALNVEMGNIILRACDGTTLWSAFPEGRAPNELGIYWTIKGYEIVLETFEETFIWSSVSIQSATLTPLQNGFSGMGMVSSNNNGAPTTTTSMDTGMLAYVIVACVVGTVIVMSMVFCAVRSFQNKRRGEEGKSLQNGGSNIDVPKASELHGVFPQQQNGPSQNNPIRSTF